MHINAECPLCHTRYQLDPSLRGQAIRCPNSACRHVFAVEEVPPPNDPGGGPPPSNGGGSRSGDVSDFVPLLPAEHVRETTLEVVPSDDDPAPVEDDDYVPVVEAQPADAPERAGAAPPWHQPPPVRRAGAAGDRPAAEAPPAPARRKKTRPEPSPAPPPPEPVEPEVAPHSWDAPPPVRNPALAGAGDVSSPPDAPPAFPKRPAPKGARWAVRAVGAGVVLTAVVICAMLAYYWNAVAHKEERLFEQAKKALGDEQYGTAVTPLRTLTEQFSDSAEIEQYRFLLALSELLTDLTTHAVPDEEGLDRVRKFVDANKKSPFLEPNGRALGKATVKLIDDVNARGKSSPDDNTPALVTKSQQALNAVNPIKDAVTADEVRRLNSGFEEARRAVALWKDLSARLEQVKLVAGDDRARVADRIKTIGLVARAADRVHPGFSARDEVRATLEGLYRKHIESVGYDKVDAVLPPAARPDPRVPTGVAFGPQAAPASGKSPPRATDPVVLALARGVLYALDPADQGRVVWVRRVGADTRTLPKRVPPSATFPGGLVLVQSADTATVTALNAADGTEVWRYQLESPCLGSPVVIEQNNSQRAFLPTYEGFVHEVELAGGRLLGRFRLGSHLTLGGAREVRPREDPSAAKGEPRYYEVVYFPADDFCVYALDVTRHRCEAILYTDHPSGSLRGSPIVVAPETQHVAGQELKIPGTLILNQTDGLEAVRLRAFELPLKDRFGPPLTPEPRVPGWTWFRPAHDPERAALVTDAGLLQLVGIKSANSNDPPLFPMTAKPIDLTELLKPEGTARDTAQVVHAQGNDFWVLALGKLQRVQLAWRPEGPTPAAAWDRPLSLGSPLHESQVIADPVTGRSVLVVVTQQSDRQECLATAVDDEDGHVLWQRRLGVVSRSEPVALARDGAPPVSVAQGPGGELAALDPKELPATPPRRWLLEEGDPLAPSAAGLADVPRLVPGPDGKTAYALTCVADGGKYRLEVRHVGYAPGGTRPVVTRTQKFDGVAAPPVGPPALLPPAAPGGDPALVLLLADGNSVRVSLAGAGEILGGPTWRSRRVGPEGRGYVAALGPDRFLTADATDPAHGLRCWKWTERGAEPAHDPQAKNPDSDTDPPNYRLDERLAGAPLVVPAGPGRAAALVCFADASGWMQVLRVDPARGFLKETASRFDLKGTVTDGPYLRAAADGSPRVACVVGGNRLVWVDPGDGADRPGGILWEYPSGGKPGGPPFVGGPRAAGGVLVLADLSGRYTAVDPESGKGVGEGYALEGSVGPACGPVPFDDGRVLAPLTDGTALLLPMRRFAPAPPAGAGNGSWWRPAGVP